MKKIILVIIVLFTVIPTFVSAALADGLSGRILLQVQDKGQAWYVDPVLKTRVFLGRPDDAFTIMRIFGLGITDSNLAKIGQENQADADLPDDHRP